MDPLAKLYNDISLNYGKNDHADIFGKTTQVKMDQIISEGILKNKQLSIIDLGVGDGAVLRRLDALQPGNMLVGLDISDKLLEMAKANLPKARMILSTIEDLQNHCERSTYDLVIGDFVCAYVGLPKLLEQANYLLKPGGFLAFRTSLRSSCPEIKRQLDAMKHSWNVNKKILCHLSANADRQNHVPESAEEVGNLLNEYGFVGKQQEVVTIDGSCQTLQEHYDLLVNSGWGMHILQHPVLPAWLLRNLVSHFLKYVKYPIYDYLLVNVGLAQKGGIPPNP